MDADGVFPGMFKKNFQYTLLLLVHVVAMGTHKAIINEVFHCYINKYKKVKTADKGRLHQWLQGLFIALYAWSSGTVDGNGIAWSVVSIGREFPFTIEL